MQLIGLSRLNICHTVNKQPRNMSVIMGKGGMETIYGPMRWKGLNVIFTYGSKI